MIKFDDTQTAQLSAVLQDYLSQTYNGIAATFEQVREETDMAMIDRAAMDIYNTMRCRACAYMLIQHIERFAEPDDVDDLPFTDDSAEVEKVEEPQPQPKPKHHGKAYATA